MKVIVRKKSKTVQASNKTAFDRQFNKVSEELEDNAELVWDTAPMTVHFIYEETVQIPETLAEQFELEGLVLHCVDCPHFVKGKNKNYRSKGCEFKEGCKDFTAACELCYQEVLAGKVKTLKRRKP